MYALDKVGAQNFDMNEFINFTNRAKTLIMNKEEKDAVNERNFDQRNTESNKLLKPAASLEQNSKQRHKRHKSLFTPDILSSTHLMKKQKRQDDIPLI